MLVSVPSLVRVRAWNRLEEILRDYPSYYIDVLTHLHNKAPNPVYIEMIRRVLLHGDFLREEEPRPISLGLVLVQFTPDNTDEETAHFLALLGVKCDLMKNTNSKAWALLRISGSEAPFPSAIEIVDSYFDMLNLSCSKEDLIISIASNRSSVFAIVLMMITNVLTPLYLLAQYNERSLYWTTSTSRPVMMDGVDIDKVRDHILSCLTREQLSSVLVGCSKRVHTIGTSSFSCYIENKLKKVLQRLD